MIKYLFETRQNYDFFIVQFIIFFRTGRWSLPAESRSSWRHLLQPEDGARERGAAERDQQPGHVASIERGPR